VILDKKDERRLSEAALANLPNRGGNPERPRILTLNQAKRRGERVNTTAFGRVVLNIPIVDMQAINLRYPDTAAPDAEVRTRAWDKFLASPESEPYRVSRTDGKQVRR